MRTWSPPRRHTRCSMHTHVRECKLVSGAQAAPVRAQMCSMHTCGTPAHPASAHAFSCRHSGAHSAHTGTGRQCTHMCMYTYCWRLPVLRQRGVVFLLNFLPPPCSALCGNGIVLCASSLPPGEVWLCAGLDSCACSQQGGNTSSLHEGCSQDKGAESS